MNIDIRKLREEAKITQKELATRVSLPQGTISRYEDKPNTIPFPTMIKLLNALGTSVAELLPVQIPIFEALDCGDPYHELFDKLEGLRQFVDKSKKSSEQSIFAGALSTLPLRNLISHLDRKPNILFAGPSDSGKTTVINTLLGHPKLLPTSYAPTTGVTTYIRHISEKPEWLMEDVLLLGPEHEPSEWRDVVFTNSKTEPSSAVTPGNIQTYRNYCVADGRSWQKGRVRSAHVFIDAPLLRSCSLIDMPGTDSILQTGFGVALAELRFEVLVYTSPWSSFIEKGEEQFLFALMKRLPLLPGLHGLDNLFLLMTHASSITDGDGKVVAEDPTKNVSRRLFKSADEKVFVTRVRDRGPEYYMIPEPSLVADRMFTFWFEDPSSRHCFETDLAQLLRTKLIKPWTQAVLEDLKDASILEIAKLTKLSEYYHRINEMPRPKAEESAELITSEQARRKRLLRSRKSLISNVDKLNQGFIKDFRSLFADIFSKSNIVDTLQSFDHFDEARRGILIPLFQQLKDKYTDMSEELRYDLDRLIEDVFDILYDVPPVFREGFNPIDAFAFGVEKELDFKVNLSFTQSIDSNPGSIPHRLQGNISQLELEQESILPFEVILRFSERIAEISAFGENWRRSFARKTVIVINDINLLDSMIDNWISFMDKMKNGFLIGIDELIIHWKHFFRTQKSLYTDHKKTVHYLEASLGEMNDRIKTYGDFRAKLPH